MSKRKPPKGDIRLTEAERRGETHMQLFERLARVVNMHGRPGPRKPKGGGK